jgi:hypothetical protein
MSIVKSPGTLFLSLNVVITLCNFSPVGQEIAFGKAIITRFLHRIIDEFETPNLTPGIPIRRPRKGNRENYYHFHKIIS